MTAWLSDSGLLLAQDQVYHPAAPDVRDRAPGDIKGDHLQSKENRLLDRQGVRGRHIPSMKCTPRRRCLTKKRPYSTLPWFQHQHSPTTKCSHRSVPSTH